MTQKNTYTILIVDDETTMRKYLEKTISVKFPDYLVKSAKDGKTALKIIKKHPADLIIMDINMPGMDGYETTKKIHELEGELTTPVIFLTGANQINDQFEKSIQAGGMDYLTKPIKPAELHSLISLYLRFIERERKINDELQDTNQMLINEIQTRKKFENELVEAYSFHNNLIDAIPDLVFYKDSENNFLGCNKAFAKLFHISQMQIKGKTEKDLFSKEETAFFQKREKEMLDQKFPIFFDQQIKLKNSNVVLLETLLTPYYDKNENILGTIGICRDITQRRAIEDALIQSEKKFRGLFNASVDGILLTDLDGNIVNANPALLEMTGYTKEELIGKHFREITPEMYHDMEVEIVDSQIMKRGFSNIYEKEYIKKDGSTFPVSLSAWLERNEIGKPIGMQAFIRDISAQKLADETIRQSTQKFKELAENINEIFWINENNKIVYISPAFERICQMSVDEIYENPYSFLKRIHPDDKSGIKMALRSPGFIKHRRIYEEFRILLPDGTVNWLYARSFLSFKDDAMVRSVGIAEDISLRKKAEEEIRSALERSYELNKMKSNFVSMVSHEFRTPLSVIFSSVEILKDYFDKMTPEQKAEQFSDIEASTKQLVSLLDDIITINKADIKRPELQLERINFMEFMEQIIRESKLEYGAYPNIIFETDNGIPEIETDRKMLTHIFTNLISNAIKYTPNERSVTINIIPGTAVVKVEIIDEGIGIPEEDQETLFEPFMRASNVGNIKGSGLGLAITKRFVTNLRGEITFKSCIMKGTNFIITLPIEY